MTLQKFIDALPRINTERNYWFVRTNGGDYYKEFIEDGVIAIGYDKVTLDDISIARPDDEVSLGKLADIIKREYPKDEEYRPRFSATQLRNFVYKIKKGDIVVIPNVKSEIFAIGEVIETPAFSEDTSARNKYKCPFQKRKKVEWIKTSYRRDMDPILYKLIYTQQTVTNVSTYSKYIDQIISSFFIKGEKANIVIGVESQEEINMKEFFQMGNLLLEITEEFFNEENMEFNPDNYNVRMNIQSPGLFVLSGIDWSGIVVIGLIIIALAGGGFHYKGENANIGIKTDGIIEKIRLFLNSNNNRNGKTALLEKALKDLDIKDPDDIIKLMKEFEEGKN